MDISWINGKCYHKKWLSQYPSLTVIMAKTKILNILTRICFAEDLVAVVGIIAGCSLLVVLWCTFTYFGKKREKARGEAAKEAVKRTIVVYQNLGENGWRGANWRFLVHQQVMTHSRTWNYQIIWLCSYRYCKKNCFLTIRGKREEYRRK